MQLTTLLSSSLHADGASSALSPLASPPCASSASCRTALCKTPSVSAPSGAGGQAELLPSVTVVVVEVTVLVVRKKRYAVRIHLSQSSSLSSVLLCSKCFFTETFYLLRLGVLTVEVNHSLWSSNNLRKVLRYS